MQPVNIKKNVLCIQGQNEKGKEKNGKKFDPFEILNQIKRAYSS